MFSLLCVILIYVHVTGTVVGLPCFILFHLLSVQPPQLRITADTAGVVEAGDMFSIRCEVTYGDVLSTLQLMWMDPSGKATVC